MLRLLLLICFLTGSVTGSKNEFQAQTAQAYITCNICRIFVKNLPEYCTNLRNKLDLPHLCTYWTLLWCSYSMRFVPVWNNCRQFRQFSNCPMRTKNVIWNPRGLNGRKLPGATDVRLAKKVIYISFFRLKWDIIKFCRIRWIWGERKWASRICGFCGVSMHFYVSFRRVSCPTLWLSGLQFPAFSIFTYAITGVC